MAPAFSVVIPTFNHAHFLKTAVDSVLAQTFEDFEVIIVNNFSTDHTLDVIGQIKDPRVQAINFQNNGIIAAARNVGIRASQGKYVAFLDSDDTWYPNKLERVAQEIETAPDAGLICHDQDITRDWKPAGQAHYGPAQGYLGNMHDYLLLRGNCVSPSAAVVARRFLNEVDCFCEEQALVTVEDYDLWLRLAKVCEFKFIPEALGLHNYHAGGVSANAELHLRATLALLSKHYSQCEEPNRFYLKWALRRRISRSYYGAARECQRMGSFKKPVGYYIRTFWCDPFQPRAFAGLALLVVDIVLGQVRRRKIIRSLFPGAKFATWLIS